MPKFRVLVSYGANGFRQHTFGENRMEYVKLRLRVHSTHELEVLIVCKIQIIQSYGK